MANIKDMTRSETIMFRLPKDLKDKIIKNAALDNRTMSEYVLLCLLDYFKIKEADNND